MDDGPPAVLADPDRDRKPTAYGHGLIVAFSVTQPTASDTVNRALARAAGAIAAVGVTGVVAALTPAWFLILFAVVSQCRPE